MPILCLVTGITIQMEFRNCRKKMKVINTADLFCGAGGASTGMEEALARRKMKHRGIAINHWKVAVETMKTNHSDIDTKCMSMEAAVPGDLVPGKRLQLLWASPSCTHFSKARGGKPCDQQMRAQPDLVFTWVDQVYVEQVIIENVPEFIEWGPLNTDGTPDKRKKGNNFKAWIYGFKMRGYDVDWRIVNCADYGDATTRKRFFLKAVKKGLGLKIRWPEPMYAEKPFGKLKKWRGVKECLDLSDTGKSIFGRKKPLSKNTLRRIMVGLKKFNGLDFQLDMLGSGNGKEDHTRVRKLDLPLPTQHAGGNRTAIVRPFIVKLRNHETAENIERPLSTVTTSGAHHMLCNPVVVDCIGHGGKVRDLGEPIGTQCTHDRFAVVTPLILGQQSCAAARPADEPCPTIATAGAIRGIFPVLEDGRVLDIRIRMLKPSELAAAHSFPKDYVLTGNRGDQVKQIGNSVPVMTAAAMCESSLAELEEREKLRP